MIHHKRLFHPTLFAVLLCGASIAGVRAQEADSERPQPPHGPPPSPLFDALDTNHDGIISADEIANASTALKALLKNGATQITREDVRPPRPAAPRERRERDEQGPPRPLSDADSFRPHHPPTTEDSTAEDAAPPRPHEGADRPMHRPPPLAPTDGPATDEHAQPRHPVNDDADVAPHPADDSARDARDTGHPGAFRRDPSERPSHRFAPRSPLFEALDANHDGVISADEIANAPAALKTLEKNGSDQIKREDLRPLPPPREND